MIPILSPVPKFLFGIPWPRDAEHAEQVHRTLVFGFALLLWAPVFTPVFYWLGSPRGAAMIVVSSLNLIAILSSLRWARCPRLSSNLVVGNLLTLLAELACVSGGIDGPSLMWLPVVPMIAVVTCGTRSGVVWSLLSCGVALGFFAIRQLGYSFRLEIDPSDRSLLAVSSLCGITLCSLALTWLFKLGESNIRRDLEQARSAADQANCAKGAFLANMSHEIRTPMNAIMGMTELVLGSPLNREQREYLSVVHESCESLLSLINDILDFSKIDAGKITLQQEPFDVQELLANTVKAFSLRAHQQRLELLQQVDADAPRWVVGDPLRLRQVLVNLIGNALKFTEQGEVEVALRCCERSSQRVILCFAVRDTGIGVPADKQRAIFEMFEQADNSITRRFGGTGLGLAICSRLVELMGGELTVDSQVGEGSTFSFQAAFALAEGRAEDAEGSRVSLASLRGRRVLVIDDNATNRRILEDTLSQWGLPTETAAGAREGLAKLRAAFVNHVPFEIVITDEQMPEIDGFMFAQLVQDEPRFARVALLMLTSSGAPDDMSRYAALGISSYLAKPIKRSELLSAIAQALGAEERRASTKSSTPGDSASTPPHAGCRILLAEDSVVNQKLAVAMLGKMGCHITVAPNGKEAVARFVPGRFDLVLMDVQMPEMDGFEATRQIRAREAESADPAVPIIAMTAHALQEDRDRCLAAGMTSYLAKPIRSHELQRVLADALSATGCVERPVGVE
ncbi:MAG: response regulator [Pirellulales bacterium]